MGIRFRYRNFKAKYKDQRFEINEIKKYLKPDDIFIDVGANKGSYLLTTSKLLNQGKVYAFEPQPILHSYLKKEIDDIKLHNVILENLALSNFKGQATLHIPGDNKTSPGASLENIVKAQPDNTYTVETSTLDKYFEDISFNIGAIKIDVEGHEMAVIDGGLKIINHFKPLIVIEIENRHLVNNSVEKTLKYFYELGYDGQFIDQFKGLLPIDEFNPKIHQSNVGERFWDNKHYCNNFIMKPVN